MFWGIMKSTYFNSVSDRDTLFCPMLDARRMEVYYAIYDSEGNKIKDIAAEIISNDTFIDFPESRKIVFFGDGAMKCKEVINRANALFVTDYSISASHMLKPVLKSYEDQLFEDVAYFEPLYLKDFIVSKPRKNIFGK
jgi:tRNA threonylcarbamoyladenosine biosynthesis protein TsaB